MTPDQILATLATCDGLPREAMKAAREHRDEMLPQFLAHIERLATATVDTVTDVDKDACLFVFHLLGEWRDPRAYRPLTRLLRVDPKLLDLVLGDGLTQCASRVIAGVFDGDLQPIFDVIEDPDADEFARSQMIDALVIIAHNDPSTRSAIVVYLAAFFDLDQQRPEQRQQRGIERRLCSRPVDQRAQRVRPGDRFPHLEAGRLLTDPAPWRPTILLAVKKT